jgi:hypothetical protein
VLRYVQCICQIMGGDGAELRRPSAYILRHGVPSLSGGRAEQSLQAGIVKAALIVRVLGGLLRGHGRRTPFEGVVTVFGSTELI